VSRTRPAKTDLLEDLRFYISRIALKKIVFTFHHRTPSYKEQRERESGSERARERMRERMRERESE
jgi:hypothetical protein